VLAKQLDPGAWLGQPEAMVDAPFRLPAEITGSRLHLHRWSVADVDDLSQAVERNIEHLRPWMPWVEAEPVDRAGRLELIESWETRWASAGEAMYGAFLDGGIVGGCGLHRRCGPGGLEIGYWVDKDHLRRGVATEMARLLTTIGFAAPDISFVEIHHDKANVVSSRVPGRLGYARVGETLDKRTAPGEVGIDCAWRIERADWASDVMAEAEAGGAAEADAAVAVEVAAAEG
jgi:ribosomal-protein-serine acetyltransferase